MISLSGGYVLQPDLISHSSASGNRVVYALVIDISVQGIVEIAVYSHGLLNRQE